MAGCRMLVSPEAVEMLATHPFQARAVFDRIKAWDATSANIVTLGQNHVSLIYTPRRGPTGELGIDIEGSVSS